MKPIDADTLSRWLEIARRGARFCADENVTTELEDLEQEMREHYLEALRREASR